MPPSNMNGILLHAAGTAPESPRYVTTPYKLTSRLAEQMNGLGDDLEWVVLRNWHGHQRGWDDGVSYLPYLTQAEIPYRFGWLAGFSYNAVYKSKLMLYGANVGDHDSTQLSYVAASMRNVRDYLDKDVVFGVDRWQGLPDHHKEYFMDLARYEGLIIAGEGMRDKADYGVQWVDADISTTRPPPGRPDPKQLWVANKAAGIEVVNDAPETNFVISHSLYKETIV